MAHEHLILIILQCESFQYFVIFHSDPHHYDVTIIFQSCVSRSTGYTQKNSSECDSSSSCERIKSKQVTKLLFN